MSSSQFRDSNFGNRIRFPIHVQPQFNQDWNFEKLVAKSENWGPPLARSINNRPCKLEVASTFLASLPYIILHIANLRSFVVTCLSPYPVSSVLSALCLCVHNSCDIHLGLIIGAARPVPSAHSIWSCIYMSVKTNIIYNILQHEAYRGGS